MTDGSQPVLKVIHDFLLDAFSEEELHGLFYYAVDGELRKARYEYADTDGKSARIRKALEYCERRDLLDELLDEIELWRPGKLQTLPDGRTGALQAERIEKLLQRGAQVPEASEAVARAKVSLKYNCQQIERMKERKDAHDALQVVEGSHRALYDQLYDGNGQLGPLGPRDWRSSASSKSALQINIARLLAEVEGKSFGATVDERLAGLRSAHDDLQSAYDHRDDLLLDQTLYEIDHVVGTTTSPINDFLISAIRDLQLTDLVHELQSVYESVKAHGGGSAVPELQEDEKAVAKLGRMSERLIACQEEHHAWQDLDNRLRNELKQMEAGLNVRSFQRNWTRNLRGDMVALCGSLQPGWEQDPDCPINKVDAALARTPLNPEEVVDAFFACRSMATNHFVRVDRRLQRLCEAMAKAGDWWRVALERVA